MQQQHTTEGEAAASLLDPLPDALRADWLCAVSQWMAEYRRGQIVPISGPALPQASSSPCDRDDEGTGTHPPTPNREVQVPLTEAEQDILDFLKRAPTGDDGLPLSYKGDEIAFGIEKAYNYVKDLLAPSGLLRQRDLITHRRNVGYRVSLRLLERSTSPEVADG